MHITMQPQEVRQALIKYLVEHQMIQKDQTNLVEFKFINMRKGKGLITEVHFTQSTSELGYAERQIDLEEMISKNPIVSTADIDHDACPFIPNSVDVYKTQNPDPVFSTSAETVTPEATKSLFA